MRLALVSGFTQTARSWDPLIPPLRAAGHEIVTAEPAGHGAASDVRADLVADAGRLADEVGDAVWLGYSMGGRVCLNVALRRPEVVRGLVLVSTTAGIDTEAGRTDRRAADEALASSIETDGVGPFVDRWLAGPLWATLPPERAGVGVRLTNTPAGLAASLRLAGTGTMEPLWDRLAQVRVPVLIVTGALDPKFGSAGDRLERSFGSVATRVVVRHAGHALPWEKPEAFTAAVLRWLDVSQEPAPR